MLRRRDRCKMFESCCPTVISERADVTVPTTVRAFANVGEVEIGCIGPPIIARNMSDSPDSPGAICNCTVTQRLCVDIPIVFCAQADVGDEQVCFTTPEENNYPYEYNAVCSTTFEGDNCPCK